MNCYEVIAGPPVFAEIKALLKSVQLGTSTIVSKKGLISYDDSIDVVQPTDILRYFIEAGLDHSSNKALANIFLAHLSSTEINSAGSGVIFCTAFCNYLQKGLRFQQLNKKSPIEYHTFSGKKARLQDLEKTLASFFDEGTCGLILKAANTIGSEGSISVTTHSTNHRSSLTIDDMYRFDASVNDVFIQQTGRSDFTLTSPAIVTIDGFIESTSEIDMLMRQSFESGQPAIIVARGFQGDVANTLAHNYVNGKLRIVPIEVRYDEIGANSLVDMSKVVKSKFINSLRGDLISTTSLEEDAGTATKVIISKGEIGIEVSYKSNSIEQKIIDRQKLKLLKKLEGSNETVSKILDSRIRSLTPSNCKISIRTSKGMRGIEKDRANNALRIMQDVCSFGFVDLTTVNIHDSYFISTLLKELIESGITHVPTKTLNAGIRAAAYCAQTFLQLGACLVIDEQADTCL